LWKGAVVYLLCIPVFMRHELRWQSVGAIHIAALYTRLVAPDAEADGSRGGLKDHGAVRLPVGVQAMGLTPLMYPSFRLIKSGAGGLVNMEGVTTVQPGFVLNWLMLVTVGLAGGAPWCRCMPGNNVLLQYSGVERLYPGGYHNLSF
jgi:hypothetical protein